MTSGVQLSGKKPRHPAVRPNPSVKRSANGAAPSPEWRYAVHFRRSGLGAAPLAPAYFERSAASHNQFHTHRMNARLFLATCLAGLPGVVAVAWLALPILVAGRALPVPLWVAQLASVAQSAMLLALAAFVGTALAPRVNLASPVLFAIVEAKPIVASLRPQLVPGAIGGMLGAAILCFFTGLAPDALTDVQAQFSIPAVARLLYGGVTEEVLIRWGLMTSVVWLLWRIAQGGVGSPSAAVICASIGISAAAFGFGHLPAVSAMVGNVSPSLATYVVTSNAAFGLVAGWLYWRFGLESAILAHTLAHAIVLLVSL